MPRTYDLVMTHLLDADDYFIHRVQEQCARRGLNFFLVEPEWVEAFYEKLAVGKIRVLALLNMHSEHHDPGDIFHRLVRLADRHGARVIDPPDVALAAFNKAALHPRLEAAGVPVPPTLVIPREHVEGLRLSEGNHATLGSPFVIKPSLGYGRKGVLLDATSEADLARSVAAWPDAHYLLQRRIAPRLIEGEPAYFRVYHVFGSVWACWWNCFNDRYRLLTVEERDLHSLQSIEDIVRHIAALTGMSFFSTEIAQTEDGGFVAIDYVNDQCHLATQSAAPQNGVPDALVAAIAARLVEGVAESLRKA